MFQASEDQSHLVMKLGLFPLEPGMHPWKRMDVLDDVLHRMFRGAYTLAIASGASPEEAIASFHVQFRRIIEEMGEAPYAQSHAIAAMYFNAIYSTQNEVV